MTTAGQHNLPLDRLENWMRDHIEGFRGPLDAEQFAGGQSNPTYKLLSDAGSYVLRRKPTGHLLPSAHAIDREYRVMRALSGTAVPVPEVFALCEDDRVIGSVFYVMEFLGGRIFWDPRLPGLAPAERRAMFHSMNAVIAALHLIDYVAGGLAEAGQLHGAPNRALEPAIPRLGDREAARDGSADRLAAAASPRRRRAAHRPRRLPHRQSDFSPDRAAGDRRARLGVVDNR
jgi:aminoglycoside phosphotransferase (APT) family kinase protein